MHYKILNTSFFKPDGKNKAQQQQEWLSSKAYNSFPKRNSLEVAIAVNLRESEATKFCRGCWKLKQSHNLNMVYEEYQLPYPTPNPQM